MGVKGERRKQGGREGGERKGRKSDLSDFKVSWDHRIL